MAISPYDQETRQRAVRLYFEELADGVESKAAALRAIEAVIGIKTSTIRNWVRAEEKKGSRGRRAIRRRERRGTYRPAQRKCPAQRSQRDPETGLSFLRSGGARPQTEVIVDFLRTHRHLYSIEQMCRVLNEHEYAISPATFYRFQARGFGPTPAELDEAYDAHRLFELWRANRRVYGRRKLWKAAHRAGWNIGRDQVQRLMKILGIAGVLRCKTTRTTVADSTAQRFPDRIQRAWSQAQRPDQW